MSSDIAVLHICSNTVPILNMTVVTNSWHYVYSCEIERKGHDVIFFYDLIILAPHIPDSSFSKVTARTRSFEKGSADYTQFKYK